MEFADGTHTWLCEACTGGHQTKRTVPDSGFVIYSKQTGEFFACSPRCARSLLETMITAGAR